MQIALLEPLFTVFSPSSPIREFSQDALGREAYARYLAGAITSYVEPDSLVVGLDGAWGTGKTSILNLVVKTFSEGSWASLPIIIRFNPWYFSDHENLLRQFFKAFSVRLSQNGAETYRDAAEKIDLFAHILESVADDVPLGFMAKIGAAVTRSIGGSVKRRADKADSLDSIKDQISRDLAKGKRRVVVFIDDIDRLTKSEIRLIFRLVKAVADFKYVTYVLAFDEVVVKRALRKVGGADYLDKIINVPLNAPIATRIQVQRVIFDRLNRFSEIYNNYSWANNKRVGSVIEFVTTTFKTIRHLERTMNALHFAAGKLKDEVDYVDLISIMSLRATMPEAYRLIRDSRSLFLDSTEVLIDKERSDKEAKSVLDAFLATQKNSEALADLLAEMFPRFERYMGRRSMSDAGNEHEWNSGRRICSTRSFDAYFVLDVPDGDIAAGRINSILDHLSETSFALDFKALLAEGVDQALVFLERLGDHLDEPRVLTKSEPIVKVLLNLGDAFPSDLRGFPFKLDGKTLVMRLVFQIVRRIPDEAERFALLKSAISAAEESLYAPATTVSVEDQAHRRFEDSSRPRDPSGNGELVTEEHLDELEQIMEKKIADWAKSGRLAHHQSLAYLLFRWRNWSDHLTVENYILNDLDDQNFVRLAVELGRSQAQQTFRSVPTFVGSPIVKLVRLSLLVGRLKSVLAGSERSVIPDDLLADAIILANEDIMEIPQ